MSNLSIKELRKERARLGHRSPGWIRALIIAGGIFILLILAGFFIAPSIAKSQMEKRLSAELKRDVRITKVRLNPLALSVTIEGLAIKERDGRPFVGWRKLFVNFNSSSFFNDEWKFEEVALDGFASRIAVGTDGKLNFADILDSLSKTKPAPAKQKTKPLRITRLAVTDTSIDYSDVSRPDPFATKVGPISFFLRQFSTGGANQAPGEFNAETEAGETIKWRGALALAPLRSNGEVWLGKIVLQKYRPLLESFVKFDLIDGSLDASTRYEFVIADGRPALNLTEGQGKLSTLKIARRNESSPVIELGLIELAGLSSDTARRSAGITRLAVTGGNIKARREAAGIDLVDLLTPIQSQPPSLVTAAPGPKQAPFDLKIGEISVRQLAVAITDTTTARPAQLQLDEFGFGASAIALTQLAEPVPLELSARIAGGGTLRVSGRLAPQPLRGELTAELTALPLLAASPYLEPFVNLRVARGTVTSRMQVRVETPAGGAPMIAADGDASVDNLSVLDAGAGEEFARWSSLAVRGLSFTSAPDTKLIASEVEWTDPVGRLILLADGTNNLATLLVSRASDVQTPSVSFKPTGAPTERAVKSDAAYMALDRFILNNATLDYVDRSVNPQVKFALNELGGTIAGLSSANLDRATVDLRGKVDGVAPVTISGRINPLAAEAFTDLKINFKNIELLPAGPYVSKYAGYRLTRGALSLDVKVRLAKRKIDSDSVATLDQFTLGDKTESPDATKLPLTLALALLRDTRGQIVVDLPIDGNLDDPNFRIGRVVWRVIGNLLTKAATSPFALLGSMFGGGNKGEELAFQEFDGGSSELTGESIDKLQVMAKALRERPALRLEIAGGYDPDKDAPVLRERELERSVRLALWEDMRRTNPPGAPTPPPEQVTVTPEGSTRMITALYRAAFSSGEDTSPAPVPTEKPTADAPEETKRTWTSVFRIFRRNAAAAETKPVSKPSSKGGGALSASKTSPGDDAIEAPLPPLEEMRTKLLALIPTDENTLRQLASARAQRVREYLVNEGEVSAERISLVADTTKNARASLQLK